MDEERGRGYGVWELGVGGGGGGDTGGHQIKDGIAFGSNRNILWEGVHQITEETAFESSRNILGTEGHQIIIIIITIINY